MRSFEIACSVAVLVFRPVSARGDVCRVCSCDRLVEELLWESGGGLLTK